MNMVSKGPVELSNGAIYMGQWDLENGHREGKGIMIWKDGSKFTGMWHNDMAQGLGRLIHADGDFYEG